ncbi:hypothetical protein ACKI1J_02585 [Streptomyces scabiei]|uniref:hypothetical protein n=1 Tax=Streptomyces scabiei TaxID=1930 RepID=UPI0038F80314
MDDKSAGRRGGWRSKAVASGAAAVVLLSGCSAGTTDRAAAPGEKASGPSASSASASGKKSAAGGKASPTPSVTPFAVDPERVPRSGREGAALAAKVAMRPKDWGAGFRAQPLARSAAGTVAVLDEECRWQRRARPEGVLGSLSRYSELPGDGKRGTVKVTATVTVHSTVLGADDQMSEMLEEALRCPEQQVRADERITKLMSVGTPRGLRGNDYADDSVVETGAYLTGSGEALYRWMVTRLGPVTLTVSFKGAAGYTVDDLEQYVTRGTITMLDRVAYELGGGEK